MRVVAPGNFVRPAPGAPAAAGHRPRARAAPRGGPPGVGDGPGLERPIPSSKNETQGSVKRELQGCLKKGVIALLNGFKG